MKNKVIVIGEDVIGQLKLYSQHVRVTPHKVYLNNNDAVKMSKRLGLTNRNRPTIVTKAKASRIAQYMNASECGVDVNGIYYWSSNNPYGKWGSYEIVKTMICSSKGDYYGLLQDRDIRGILVNKVWHDRRNWTSFVKTIEELLNEAMTKGDAVSVVEYSPIHRQRRFSPYKKMQHLIA